MPTPSDVNYLLQLLITFLSIPQLSEYKNQKVDVQILYVFLNYLTQPIGIYGFKGYTIFLYILGCLA